MKTKKKSKKRVNAPARFTGEKLTNYELLRLRGGDDPPPPPPPPPGQKG